MKTRLCLAAVLAGVACASEPARAETDNAGAEQSPSVGVAEAGAGRSYVSVIDQPTEEPILVIRYPWKRIARPSVEVRVLEEDEVDNKQIQPLSFFHEVMKGKILVAVYRCQDRAAGVPQNATFAHDGIDYDAFGARNQLGRPSVTVACRTKPVQSERETRARAAFCLLAPWAVDQRTLYLELPASHFSQPSKIRVWFLRGRDVVWTQTADWPGTAQESADGPPTDGT